MASALVTIQDGSATAVAVGGASQPVGVNVTAGNTITVAVVDTVNLLAWSCRLLWTNGLVQEQTFSANSMTVNQASSFNATFVMPAEGTGFILETAVVNSLATPTVTRSVVGLYASSAGGAKVTFPATADLGLLINTLNGARYAPPAAQVHGVRGVNTANIASLTAFTVATVDGLTYAQGQKILLVGQTTKSQNGIYQVGVVATGVAPLTRVAEWATGNIVAPGTIVEVSEGTLFANTVWKVTTTGAIIVDTTNVDLYPRQVTQSAVLVAGTVTLANVPVLSATKTAIVIQRSVANTSTATTGGYCPTVAGATGVTAGTVGTASVVIQACVAAGTISAADVSTLTVSIVNF